MKKILTGDETCLNCCSNDFINGRFSKRPLKYGAAINGNCSKSAAALFCDE
jgi:hypothetical protein